jgi:hypothetical protein
MVPTQSTVATPSIASIPSIASMRLSRRLQATPSSTEQSSSPSQSATATMPRTMSHTTTAYAHTKLPSLQWPANVKHPSTSLPSLPSHVSSSATIVPILQLPLQQSSHHYHTNHTTTSATLNDTTNAALLVSSSPLSLDIHTMDPPLPRFSSISVPAVAASASLSASARSARVSKRWRSRLASSNDNNSLLLSMNQPQSARRYNDPLLTNDKHSYDSKSKNGSDTNYQHASIIPTSPPQRIRATLSSLAHPNQRHRRLLRQPAHSMITNDPHEPPSHATHWSLTSDTLVRL